MSVMVRRNAEASRYEVWVDDELAGFTVFEPHGDRLAFTHTETRSEFAGQGLGTELVQGALDDVRDRGLRVLPFCPFVRKFLAENAAYQDLVPADRRERFELSTSPEADG